MKNNILGIYSISAVNCSYAFQARVNAIQVDSDTYISEPSGPKSEFEEWLKSFNLDDQKGVISDLLVTHVEVRALYTQLVRKHHLMVAVDLLLSQCKRLKLVYQSSLLKLM